MFTIEYPDRIGQRPCDLNRTKKSKSMQLSRREFLNIIALAGAAGLALPGRTAAGTRISKPTREPSELYSMPPFGNVSLLHMTDCHAQLLPIYFREPSVNAGVGNSRGRAPHLVGEALLRRYRISPNSIEAHAFTHLNFEEAARLYGKVGGFAHLSTLVKSLRAQRPGRTLLLDGGDSWQGSATALWTKGQDMIGACKLLGVDVMTGHWEFTYGADWVRRVIDHDLKDKIEFLAQNVHDKTWGDLIFKPFTIREAKGISVAIIGQAYPFTPIANPRYLIPDWSFGIDEEHMQQMVDEVRARGAMLVVLLSHNGMDVDLKMATRVRGIDVILGGHTHDAMPAPSIVSNSGGKTLVINSGSHGKFLSVLDLDVRRGGIRDYRYSLLPIFANLIAPDKDMASYISKVRAPFEERLSEKIAVTETLLYRRGNFNGTFDEVIVDALRNVLGADIALSPGFRWGTTLLPGHVITLEDIMNQTAITYAATTLNEMTGARVVDLLEDIADNLFHPDPYYQQGGDMVRVGGLKYAIDPTQSRGRRISDVEVEGKPISPGKRYKVSGWASVQPQPDGRRPVWDVVAEYLRDRKRVRIAQAYVPTLKGADNNPGVGF